MLNEIEELFNYYKLDISSRNEILEIINPIVNHEEFKKRCDAKEFPHHGTVSLGHHILNDAIVTFIMCKLNRIKNYRNAVLIAMFHDLYEYPWQNSKIKKNKFVNNHGFVHPIEAAINSITWYPEYFSNLEDAKLLIDGIIHHMYPFPVRVITKDIKSLELNNLDKYNKLDNNLQNIIIESTRRHKFHNISFSRSIYEEGRIMSKADKHVAMRKDLHNISGIIALITGKNKTL